MKVLRSRVGPGMLGAAVFDDVLVILFLSLVLAVGTGECTLASVLWVLIKMASFSVLSVVFGLWALPFLASVGVSQGLMKQDYFSAVVGMILFTTLITPTTLKAMSRFEARITSGLGISVEEPNSGDLPHQVPKRHHGQSLTQSMEIGLDHLFPRQLVGDLLATWKEVGVTGATILHSSGSGRLRQAGLRDDLPLFPGLEDLYNK